MSVLSRAAGGSPGRSLSGSLHQGASVDPGMLQFTCAAGAPRDGLVTQLYVFPFSFINSVFRS